MIASSTITTNASAPQKIWYRVDPVSVWPTNDGFGERFSSGPAGDGAAFSLQKPSLATRVRSKRGAGVSGLL